MGTEEVLKNRALHVVFFPLLAHGHMIPLFDVARLFAHRGVKATIITTPANAAFFSKKLTPNNPHNITVEIIPFSPEEVGLPAGVENVEHVKEGDFLKFFEAIRSGDSQLR